nr:hypothetical protein [Vibrio mexicanus]
MTIKKNKPQATPEKEALDNKSAEPKIDDKAAEETEKVEKVEDSLAKKAHRILLKQSRPKSSLLLIRK